MSTEPKKSSCFAVGGIGCLVLIILVIAAGGFTWWKFGPQIQQKIGEFQQDPQRAAAMMMVDYNPDIEKISVDDTARTVTFRIKSSNETITATFEALANSKMTNVNGKTTFEGLERVPEGGAAPDAGTGTAPEAGTSSGASSGEPKL